MIPDWSVGPTCPSWYFVPRELKLYITTIPDHGGNRPGAVIRNALLRAPGTHSPSKLQIFIASK